MKYKTRLALSLSKGFTLMELLVVMALLAVLAVGLIVIVNPQAQFQKARDGQRKSDLAAIQKALEQYYNDYGAYPASENYKMKDASNVVHEWGSSTWTYMPVLPEDPESTQNYVYGSDGQSYGLYSRLENASDSQLCTPGSPDTWCPNVPLNGTCGPSLACNFGVSSSNISP